MYISPDVFLGSLWNLLSIFSNLLRVTVSICGLITWFLYIWENLKCDYPCFQKFSPKQPENLNGLNKMFDLLYEDVKSNNYSRKRTHLMKNFILATVDTLKEKCVPVKSPIFSEEIFENRGSHTLDFLIHTEIIQSSHKS